MNPPPAVVTKWTENIRLLLHRQLNSIILIVTSNNDIVVVDMDMKKKKRWMDECSSVGWHIHRWIFGLVVHPMDIHRRALQPTMKIFGWGTTRRRFSALSSICPMSTVICDCFNSLFQIERAVVSEISGYLKLQDGHCWQREPSTRWIAPAPSLFVCLDAADRIQGFASVVGTIAKITLTDHGTPAQQLKFVVG
jgi:hypothetical protein